MIKLSGLRAGDSNGYASGGKRGCGGVDGSSFDAIVIGAGVAGLYQLYKLRELGLRVRVFEAGAAVGGTWY